MSKKKGRHYLLSRGIALFLATSMTFTSSGFQILAAENETQAAEMQTTEAVITEAPVIEAPVAEVPVTEAPATEAPVTEAPVTEAPVTEAPATEAPVTEPPAVETPVTEAPDTQAPVAEAPTTETPITEAKVTETPESESKKDDTTEQKTETEKTVTYEVSFTDTSAVAGTIMVEGIQIDVTGFSKEIVENQPFQFTVKANDGYKVKSVKADNADIPKTGTENEYKIANVTRDTKIDVAYEELPKGESESEEAAVQNVVTFQVAEGASVTVDGKDVTNAAAMAKDGKIIFAITAAAGYEVTEVLVDGSIPARTTGNDGEYVIEGIQTDSTVVSVSTQAVTTEEGIGAETGTEAAILTVNYLVEMYNPDEDAIVYQDITEPTVIREGLVVGQEITVIDYVKDFSEQGLSYKADKEKVILEKENTLDLVYTLPEDAYAAVTLEEEKEIYTVTVYYVDKETNNHYQISSEQYEEGSEYKVPVLVKSGYSIEPQDESFNTLAATNGYITGTVTDNVIIYMVASPTNVNYIVKHLLQNVEGTSYEEPAEDSGYYETKQGLTGTDTAAEVKDIEGFVPQAFAQKEIAGDGSTVVEIKYDRDTVYLSYDSDGGSYVERQFAKYGSEVTVSTVEPEKTGYTFEGWYDGETKVEAGSKLRLNGNKTLTAKWTGKEVNYQIVYFQQQNDNSYKAVETKTGLKAKAGEKITVEVGSTNAPNNKFEYYHFASADEAVVAGDGSTSVNVYYDLNVYTLSFTLSGATNADRMTFESTGTTTYSFMARLGDNILSQWPADDEIEPYTNRNGTTYYWYSWKSSVGGAAYRSKRDVLEKAMIPDSLKYTNNGTISYTVDQTVNKKLETLTVYMKQTITASESNLDQKNTTNYAEDSELRAYSEKGLSQKELFGFDSSGETGGNSSGVAGADEAMWYIRHKYTLELKNNGENLITHEGVPFEKSLSGYLTTPAKPASVPDYYVFAGWYSNPQGAGNPIAADATMPGFATNGSTYILYGVWKPKQVTVRFDTDGGSEVESQTIAAGTTAGEPEAPTKEGYDFVGWLAEKDGELFRFDKPITDDTIVYAGWKVKTVTEYTIMYVDEDGKELATSDTKQGIVGTKVTANAKVITDYVVDSAMKSIDKLSNVASDNVITFVYHKPVDKDYYARYYYETTDKGKVYLGEAIKAGTAKEGSRVVVRANNVPQGWELDDLAQKSHTIVSGDNYIDFKVKRDFTVAAESYMDTYDGQAHGITVTGISAAEGFTVQYAESAEGPWQDEAPAYTDVAEAPETAPKTVYVKVTDTFTGESKTANATVTINPVTLTVTTQDGIKTYDGTALTAGGSIVGFVNNESATFTVTGSQTDVGNSPNTYSLVWDGTAKEGNYIITEDLGELVVNESTAIITVTTIGGTYTYDGKAHGATVKVEGVPEGYTVVTKTSNATATDVTADPVKAACDNLVIQNAKGEDVTSKLKIEYVEGSITILPAVLTINMPSASKPYDGDPLTAAGSIDGFVNGETATFETTGTRTAVGTSDNTYSLIFDQTAAAGNYTVNAAVGKLTVTETRDEIVVTTIGGEFTYDGKAHGASVNISALPVGYTLETATSDDTATNVEDGEVTANCDTLVIRNAEGEDVTSKLNIRYVVGTIKINPAALVVTTPDAEKIYDGTALTSEGTLRGLVSGETATFKTTGSQTQVGSSRNTYSLTFDGTAKQSNYTVTEYVGTLKVNEYANQITVTTTGGEYTYDGKAHGAKVSVSTLPTGYTLVKAESDDYATNVADGTVAADCDTLIIRNAEGEDVTSKLNIRYVNDTIKINPANLTIVTPNASKVYDGSALTAAGTINGFINNETATFTTTGTQTAVGDSKNTYELKWDQTAVESNYTISETIGTLTVTESTAEIIVTTTGGEFTYDGEVHGAKVSVSRLPGGYTLKKAESDDMAINVADGTVTADCDNLIIVNAAGEDVTEKLNIKYVNGTIKINPAVLTIVTPDASKVYDGTALTKAGSIEGFVKEETATFETTGSQTKAGSSKNTYSLTFDGTAIESNYAVSETIGTLTVTENEDEIVVTTTGGVFTYDGTPHGADVSVSTLPAGYTLVKAESRDTAINVKDGKIKADCDELIIQNAAGEDVTSKLNIKYVDGTIEIIPALLTITTLSAEKVYDGTALTASGEITGFVNSETATFEITGSQTKVGSSKNTYSLTWDGTAEESNYTISENIGNLKVTESTAEIVVTTTGGEFTYDGKAHRATVSVGALPTGYKVVTARSNDKAVDVEDGEVEANCDVLVIENAAGEDVTSRLNVTYVNDTIRINPAKLTITTPDAVKEYDGRPLTAAGKAEGFVNGETATFKTTGSQTIVGKSMNTYILKWDGTAEESNYTIEETLGNLEVVESTKKIIVTTIGGEFVYDGKTHGAIVNVSAMPEGYTLEKAASDDEATNVDEGTIEASCDTLIIKNAEGEDVTEKLNIEYVNGTISIIPAVLMVTTPNDSKVYDGTALTAAGKIEGFVNGETATFETTGSQTEVGSSTNSYKLTWDKTAVESNYTISESLGTLSVTENSSQIVVTTTGGVFTYDGKAHGATVSVSTLPVGYWLDTAKSNDVATNVLEGTVEANCDELIIRNASGKDVTEKLNISYVDGSITINPAQMNITTNSASKTYDGTPLTAPGSITGLAAGETVTFEVTGSQTIVGDSKNTYSLKWEGTAKESNYSISENIGTLVVNEYALPITVTTTGGEFVYDGKEHNAAVSVSTLPTGYTLEKAESDDKAKNVADGEVEADCDTLIIRNAEGEDVTNKLNIQYKNGTIKINPAPVTVVTDSAEKIYDGEALTAKGMMEGLVNGETAELKLTGTQTFVGSSDNTCEIIWAPEDGKEPGENTAKESNYNVAFTLGILTVTDGTPDKPVDPDKVITKSHNEGEYKLGETVTFTIEVTNIYAEPKTITIVEKDGVIITGSSVFENVEPGAVVTTEAVYTITEEDLLAGSFKNIAKAQFSGGNTFENDDDVDTEEPKSHITITKETTSTPAKDGKYALNETINYKITVVNDGNLTAKDVVVTDELTGDEWKISELKPQASEEFEASYVVKEADILAGKVVNVATAAGTSPDPNKPDVPVEPGEEETPTEDPAPGLSVSKAVTSTAAAADGKYALGETITYEVTVTNDGNVTIENISVADKLEGIQMANGQSGKIESLAPGESASVNYSYVVQAKDIIAGEITNVAVATGQFQESDTVKDEDEVVTLVEDKAPAVSVEKTVVNWDEANGKNGGFLEKQTIRYNICVRNTGNVALEDITVSDVMSTDNGTKLSSIPVIEAGNGYTVTENTAIISLLDVGEEMNIPVIYVVGKEDSGKTLTNTAIVSTGDITVSSEVSVDIESSETKTVKETEETKTPEKKATAAKTGDNTQIMLYILMLLAATMINGGIIIRKKRKKDEA